MSQCTRAATGMFYKELSEKNRKNSLLKQDLNSFPSIPNGYCSKYLITATSENVGIFHTL